MKMHLSKKIVVLFSLVVVVSAFIVVLVYGLRSGAEAGMPSAEVDRAGGPPHADYAGSAKAVVQRAVTSTAITGTIQNMFSADVAKAVNEYHRVLDQCHAMNKGVASTGILHKAQFNAMQHTVMDFLHRSKRYEDAIRVVESALKNPELDRRQRYILTWFLMKARYKHGDFTQAERAAKELLEQFHELVPERRYVPHYALRALSTLEECAARQGNGEKVLEYAQKALSFAEKSEYLKDLREECACHYLRRLTYYGDIEEARAFYQDYAWRYYEDDARRCIDVATRRAHCR